MSSLPLSLPLSSDVEQDYFIQLPPQYYIDLHFTRWMGMYFLGRLIQLKCSSLPKKVQCFGC